MTALMNIQVISGEVHELGYALVIYWIIALMKLQVISGGVHELGYELGYALVIS
jgi:hypothetical protein